MEGKERGGSSRGEGAEAYYREWQARLQIEEKEPVGRKSLKKWGGTQEPKGESNPSVPQWMNG